MIKPKAAAINTAQKQRELAPDAASKDEVKEARVVIMDGTAKDFESCAEHVPGWDDLGKQSKAELVGLMRNYWALGPSPEITIPQGQTGAVSIGPAEGENTTLYALRLSDTMACQSMAFLDDRVSDLATYHKRSNRGGVTSKNISSSLAFVAGAKAQDTVQSSLAVQMAATHDAAMRALGMVGAAEFTEQAKLYGKLASKLLNAYTRQAETLAKLQRGGEQVIKHVHIDNRGGQAVVTDQVVTGGQGKNVDGQPHGTGSVTQCAALLGEDTERNGVPVSFDQGQETVQATWGTVAGRA